MKWPVFKMEKKDHGRSEFEGSTRNLSLENAKFEFLLDIIQVVK